MKTLWFCIKPLGNSLAIHNVLKESGEYNIIYKAESKDDFDYVLTSHISPSIGYGKIIHLAHGLGCITKIIHNTYDEIIKDFEKYYGYCVHGKLEGLWYTGMVEHRLIVGMPASIPLLEPTNKDDRAAFLLSKNLDPSKKTIMYGPTWNHKEYREFFYLWWKDKKERERVDKFCKFITKELNMNLIIRFHESFRYSKNWLNIYKDIFEKYPNIYAHYFEDDIFGSSNLMKYSEVLVGDLSNMNTMFYVMDKPVIHIGLFPFTYRRNLGYCGVSIFDRAGYTIEKFPDMLACIQDAVENPDRFKEERKQVVDKYFDYTGNSCKEQILKEFRRVCK